MSKYFRVREKESPVGKVIEASLGEKADLSHNHDYSYIGQEDGANTGDILRWNAVTGKWESCAEPFELSQIILTPAAGPVLDQEGGIYYKATEKTLWICTEGP